MHRHVTLALEQGHDGKLKGLLPETIDKIHALNLADYIVNEADGAGGKSVKAPRHSEPVIPSTATLVVALVGLDVLNAPLSLDTAFRIELIERLTGLSYGSMITEEVLATLLTQSQGIIQNAPPSARIIPFLNKSELVPTIAVFSLASAVLARHHIQIKQVTAGSLQTKPSVYRVFHIST
jgi:probable selenium-dependent hydroxylase accessory protein YqeC